MDEYYNCGRDKQKKRNKIDKIKIELSSDMK